MTNENAKSEYLLEVKDLKQYFPVKTGFMKTLPLKAVDGVSFSIKPGETWGLSASPAAAKRRWAVRFCGCIPRQAAK